MRLFFVDHLPSSVLVWRGEENIGIIQKMPGFYSAQHLLRTTSGKFASEQDAIDYVIGLELKIDAEFDGSVKVESNRGSGRETEKGGLAA
jgi:hypothetical protein